MKAQSAMGTCWMEHLVHYFYKLEFHKALKSFTKHCPWTACIRMIWGERIKMQISKSHPRPTESESLGIGFRSLLL